MSKKEMTCPTCRLWCATSRGQLDHRLLQMLHNPEVKTYACPHCGGIDWATTGAFAGDEEVDAKLLPRSEARKVMATIMLLVTLIIAAALLAGCTGKRLATPDDPWCTLSRELCSKEQSGGNKKAD